MKAAIGGLYKRRTRSLQALLSTALTSEEASQPPPSVYKGTPSLSATLTTSSMESANGTSPRSTNLLRRKLVFDSSKMSQPAAQCFPLRDSFIFNIPQTDLRGDESDVPNFTTGEHVRVKYSERACTDDYSSSTSTQFCRMFKVSDRSRSILIPRDLEIKDNSPSKPYQKEPSRGVEQVIDAVFRGRGRGHVAKAAEYFSCWVAAPASPGFKALAFTAGHSFVHDRVIPYTENPCLDFGHSEVTGCFGGEVRTSEFATFGFDCAQNPIAIIRDEVDFSLFEISKNVQNVLLPCSISEECKENNHLAAFSYPCTHTFLVRANLELVEGRAYHGISELYSDLNLEDSVLYEKLLEVFSPFPDGTLVCSPGDIREIYQHICCYRCSTLGGSSGGPIILSHLPGYVGGIHDGGLIARNFNFATSTDSRIFVACYKKHVLPRLPPRSSSYWDGWDLGPFNRWLVKHELKW